MSTTLTSQKAQAFVVAVIAGTEVARWIETGETSDSVLADIEPQAVIVDRRGKTGASIHAIDGNGNDVMVAPYNPNNPADVHLAARSLLSI